MSTVSEMKIYKTDCKFHSNVLLLNTQIAMEVNSVRIAYGLYSLYEVYYMSNFRLENVKFILCGGKLIVNSKQSAPLLLTIWY